MFSLLALAALALQEPQEGRVTTGPNPSNALRITLSGEFDVYFVSRDGSINEAGRVLNGNPLGEQPGTNLWAGRFSLRTDVEVKDMVTGVFELQNRSFDRGINHPFSSNQDLPAAIIHQAYVNVPDFLTQNLSLRVGIQDLTLRNRPQDEPFFMDLGESESFFAGFTQTPTGAFIRNTVDRDIHEATGVRGSWAPNPFMGIDAAALYYGENASASRSETVYLLTANSMLAERWAGWVLGAVVTGGEAHLKDIGTFGAGLDGYLLDGRALEVFGEAYGQVGTLTDVPITVRKEAYAFNVGARYVGVGLDHLWLEGAFSERSGTRRADGHRDQAFQSYENENRFLILQSAEFGLDVDTNVRVLRASAGYGPIPVEGRPLRFQADVGRFSAMEPLLGATGLALAGSSRQWGLETDLTAAWSYNESLVFKVQAAWLSDSELLQALTTDREHHAILVVAGADLKF